MTSSRLDDCFSGDSESLSTKNCATGDLSCVIVHRDFRSMSRHRPFICSADAASGNHFTHKKKDLFINPYNYNEAYFSLVCIDGGLCSFFSVSLNFRY